MMSFEFRLARENDDQELRTLLKEIEMTGNIALSFEREPNYFVASNCANLKSQTMLVVDREKASIVGVASRAIRYAYVDGIKTKIGYLSNLRGKKEVRNALLLARGYKFLKKLHADNEVSFYISTIFSDNHIAQNILTSQRARLPIYHERGKITTGFISLMERFGNDGFSLALFGTKVSDSNVIRFSKSTHSIKEVVDFINAYNTKFQYAPCYSVEDFVGKNRLVGFSTNELYLYIKEGEIAGVMGAWNQTSFKQVKVNGYSKTYQYLRPLYNLYAKLKGVPALPPVGSYIQNIYGSFIAIEDNNIEVFHALLNSIKERWSNRGFSYIAIGFHENHPLHGELLKCLSQKLESVLYEVYWDEGEVVLPKERFVPYVEIATL